MKKLLTILLLVSLAALHTQGYLQSEKQDMVLLQQAEEEAKKAGGEKHGEEFITHTQPGKPWPSNPGSFVSHSCNPGLSPVSQYIAPPPDAVA